jgi:hypothetical protein
MGNCNFKEKKIESLEEGSNRIKVEKITKSSFNYQYAIGKGGFGKVKSVLILGMES